MSQVIDARTIPADQVGSAARRRSRLLRPAFMLGGIAVVAVGALYFWLQGGSTVAIDNAYVHADKLAVSTDVSGIIAEIPVKEGQTVRAGDILFRLDDRRFTIALQSAGADLAQTALTLDAAKRDYDRMIKDIANKQATVDADQARFSRIAGLVGRGDVSRQQYDDAKFQLSADQQAVASTQIAAQVQLAKLGGDATADVKTMPSYLKAQAAVDEAQRELDHATVRAPMNGIVTGVSNAQPGLYLAASSAAFGLVSTDHVWVEANPKETELTYVKPGDPVSVAIDTYAGRTWQGTVDSIAPASGAEFSILPAQNSSGNWVKVVQRITVRIRLDRKPEDPPLRAGMSVEADIDTGHTRSLSDLF
jgi:membrane fusion protein (multidrug efflux system)